VPKHLSAVTLLLSGAAALSLAACTTGSTGGSPNSTSPGQQSTPNTPTDSSGPGGLPTGVVTDTGAPGSDAPASTEPSGSSAPPSGAAKTVAVHITIGAWNSQAAAAQVDAFVPGRVIRGGTCTLTMTKADTSRTAQRPAVTTPTATSCGLIAIPRSELSAGTWSAVVRFESPTASGESDPVNIQVPA
jgi:hypothetical protein